jgi:hypothetical protein
METGLHDRTAAHGESVSIWREKLLQDITALVDAAVADREAAAAQQLEAARRISNATESDLRSQLDAALADVERKREYARTLRSQLAIEHAAKERAETSWTTSQTTQQQVVAAYAERIHALEQQLEVANREVARLTSDRDRESTEYRRMSEILESIRVAMNPGSPTPDMTVETETSTAPEPVPAECSETPAVEESLATEPEPTPITATRTLKLVATDSPDASWAQHLLEDIEVSYLEDVDHMQRPADVVDHLVSQLKNARELFLTRCSANEAEANDAFDRQISMLLDLKSTSAFGRHLGIAWYEISHPAERPDHCAVA